MEQKEILFDGSLLKYTQARLNNLRIQWKQSIIERKKLEKSSLFYFYEGENEKQFTSTPLIKARDNEISIFCDLCDYLEWFDPFIGLWHLVIEEDEIYHKNYKYNKEIKPKIQRYIEENRQLDLVLVM